MPVGLWMANQVCFLASKQFSHWTYSHLVGFYTDGLLGSNRFWSNGEGLGNVQYFGDETWTLRRRKQWISFFHGRHGRDKSLDILFECDGQFAVIQTAPEGIIECFDKVNMDARSLHIRLIFCQSNNFLLLVPSSCFYKRIFTSTLWKAGKSHVERTGRR